MAKTYTCDICKKECARIVMKVFLTPIGEGSNANSFHTKYSHHADVGACCKPRLLKSFNFRERKTAKEYRERGKS